MKDQLDMADVVVPRYSKREIVSAGKALKGSLNYSEETVQIFRIAHNWRDAHMYPMRRVRAELSSAAKRLGLETVSAARVKRMKSIRKKMRTSDYTLYQIQDIAGCRAICNSMSDVHRLVDHYKAGASKHEFQRQFDYINVAKPDGYRSYHFVLKFNGTDSAAIFNRQRIEVQIRSRLQHSWATAVEAVGLARNEDLKGGSGDADWLRLFAIMSLEIALAEGASHVPGVSQNALERREELRFLENKISASKNLNVWNTAIKVLGEVRDEGSKFYLIQYNNEEKTVVIRPSTKYSESSTELIIEERSHDSRDTVIVELDRAEDLRDAYPNYFLDISLFSDYLYSALKNLPFPALPNSSATSSGLSQVQRSFGVDLKWWWDRKR